MAPSVLSVVCRRDAVRLLRLSRMPGGMDIRLAEAMPGADDTPAGLARLAAQTALGAGLGTERLILGLDGGEATLRRLRFPFTTRSKIDLVLGPELEPHLPVPLAETALSWVKTALEPSPAVVALVAATPLMPLQDMLEALSDALLPAPGAACLDLAGLDAVLERLAPTGAALLLSLDGAQASCLCRLAGAPAIWRTFPAPTQGDPALPDILAREALLTLAAVAPSPPRDLRLFTVGITDASVAAALDRAMGATAHPVAAQPRWPKLADGTALPDRFAAAYGLALLDAADPGTRNFLRGDLAPVIAPAVKRRGLLLAGTALAAVLLCAVGSLWFAYHRLDTAIEAAGHRTAALVEQAAPDAGPGLTVTQKLSVLRGRMAAQADAAKNSSDTSGSAIELLAAIHQALGPGGRTHVRRISLDDRRATIDATADDYNTVEEVKRRLSASDLFTEVEIKGAKNVPEKKQVEFQLDMRLSGRRDSGA
ncbi:PilN domain-containing protein [Solidesulfovibrio alcoholivorans]|uniref:PilN domain-containing protein n=1 Tax=Solidesulfovibrio alcoholivorans TaxID=81406 RepID=UPI0004957C95|nr:PilN domain-containing protein [Solidesulfovibrio alcoholivorans]